MNASSVSLVLGDDGLLYTLADTSEDDAVATLDVYSRIV